MDKFFIGFLLFVSINIGYSQIEFHDVYTPMQVNTKALASNLVKTQKQLDSFLEENRDRPKPVKTTIKEINQDRYFGINYKYENNHFYTDEVLLKYFGDIMNEVYRGNPWINSNEINFLIARYPWPNAFNMGEGTIVLNIGLINIYENDAQMAFVLCHELAHQLKNHVNQDVLNRAITYNSVEFQNELKKIANSEYRQNAMYRELKKGLITDDSKHSRLHESEADSFALMLLRNTVFPEEQALIALAKLDSVDGEDLRNQLDLRAIFNFEKYPFKEKWLVEEQVIVKFNNDIYYWEVNDSLKTHPDIADRIKYLENFIQKKDNTQNNLKAEDSYKEQVFIAQFEKVECYYRSNSYDRALYAALKLRQKFPNNTYLNGIIGLMFYELYEAQKNHTFNRYVQTPSPSNSPNFKSLITFLNTLRLTELSNIGYYFLKQYQNSDYLTEDYYYSFYKLSKVLQNEEDANFAKTQYSSSFPEGKYINKF